MYEPIRRFVVVAFALALLPALAMIPSGCCTRAAQTAAAEKKSAGPTHRLDAVPAAGTSNAIAEYLNPLDLPIADPQILRHDGMYYAYGTTLDIQGMEVFSSPDLVHWRRHGFIYEKNPDTWGQNNFWAPEVIEKDGTFYLFYTALNPRLNLRSICVATADSPLGPFRDAATPIMPAGRGFIDASPYRDPETGIHYLYVLEENLRPPVIWVARLSDDLLSLDSELVECITVTQEWERGWVEGAFIVKHEKYYYMLYSGFGYMSPDYAVGYATALSPMGPWAKYEHNPVLRRSGAVSGPGHNSVVASPDGTELFTAYHRHLTFAGDWQRELAIDRIHFLENGAHPPILAVDGPTHTPRPFPSGAKPWPRGASDEFRGPGLERSRWLSFGEDETRWKVEDGHLVIETQDGDIFQDRLDAKNIFLQYAPEGDFAVETKVHFAPEANYEQAFLLVWQDQSHFLKLATVFSGGPKIEVAREVNGRYTGVTAENTVGTTLHLRIERRGQRHTFHYRGEGEPEWKTLTAGFAVDFQQPKVGLGAIAPVSGAHREARFEYLRLVPLQ